MKQIVYILLMALLLIGCSEEPTKNELNRVGLLLEGAIDDQGWNSKGYQGLLKIQSELGVDVFYKEGIIEINMVKEAVDEFVDQEVNLIFGHGRIFSEFFQEMKDEYPNVHFVAFNGEVTGENISSIHFESHAMGFFGGMVASKMSETKKIGIIAAYPWQPEVQGFVDGAMYQDEAVEVEVQYVDDWDHVEAAKEALASMVNDKVDVYYPAGDGFHVPIVEAIKKEGLFAIGFVSDQIDLGESAILTSTVQQVDRLYYVVANQFNQGQLQSGNHYYDFQDGVITMGTFSSKIPEQFQSEIEAYVEHYIQTGELPNGQ